VTREEYQASLADLRAEVVDMGALVADRLGRALTALETVDEVAAREVAAARTTRSPADTWTSNRRASSCSPANSPSRATSASSLRRSRS